jgi:hypothetical protein
MLLSKYDLQDLKRYIVRPGETDDEEPLILYRVPLEDGGDRVLMRPTSGRSWEYLVWN